MFLFFPWKGEGRSEGKGKKQTGREDARKGRELKEMGKGRQGKGEKGKRKSEGKREKKRIGRELKGKREE